MNGRLLAAHDTDLSSAPVVHAAMTPHDSLSLRLSDAVYTSAHSSQSHRAARHTNQHNTHGRQQFSDTNDTNMQCQLCRRCLSLALCFYDFNSQHSVAVPLLLTLRCSVVSTSSPRPALIFVACSA